MSLPPPPPPGSEDIPPSPGAEIPPPSASDLANIPPPAPESEQHENDVLKRRKHFSWKKFGGEGFLVSVAFHVLLLIAGLFYIVNKWREPAKKEDPTFASGSGGGANGDKAKAFEHKMQRRQPMIVKSPSRIVSKSANASVSLPSTPTTSTASFASGLSGGGMSKGSGGGSGGGEGTGIGIGKGGGKNFVSVFGARATQFDGGFVGTYYDMKYKRRLNPTDKLEPSDVWQSPPTWHSPDNASYNVCFPYKPDRNLTLDADRYYKTLNDAAYADSEQALSKYFVSPTKLFATRLWIPGSPSATSPQAFEVADVCKGHFWCVTYKALISPPSSGRWRFVGAGDDMLAVKIDKKNVLGWFWWLNKNYLKQNWIGKPARFGGPVDEPKLRHYRNATGQGMPGGAGVGDWIQMDKGKFYEFEAVIGDWGGVFHGFLLCEKEGEKYEAVPSAVEGRKEPKIHIFRTAEDPLPQGAGMPVDYIADGPVWIAKQPKASSIR
jgi:hypothetical protein